MKMNMWHFVHIYNTCSDSILNEWFTETCCIRVGFFRWKSSSRDSLPFFPALIPLEPEYQYFIMRIDPKRDRSCVLTINTWVSCPHNTQHSLLINCYMCLLTFNWTRADVKTEISLILILTYRHLLADLRDKWSEVCSSIVLQNLQHT